MKLVTQGFDVDWNQLSGAKSLRWKVKNTRYSSLCNSQQLTQPPLALSVPLSRFTPRVGGGSAAMSKVKLKSAGLVSQVFMGGLVSCWLIMVSSSDAWSVG